MKTFHLLLLMFLLVKVELVKKCPERSFTKLLVTVVEGDQSKKQTIKHCISPSTLVYNEDNVRQIHISDQNIVALKKGFINNISADFVVKISGNTIETVKEEAFLNLPQIKEIDLDHNGIEWIETNAIDSLYLLKAIDLSHNKLEQLLQNTFNNLPNLEIIALSNNRIKFFQQDWFYKTYNLEILYLDSNHITSVPRAAFISLPNLRNLELSNNHISYVHKYAFQGLILLSEILLEENWLKKIEVDFSLTPKLRFLSINHNNITFISDSSLSGLENSITSFWIHGNPWQCSCFDKIIQWGIRTNINVTWECTNTELYCVVPKNEADRCIERSDEDFHYNCFQAFKKPCNRIIM